MRDEFSPCELLPPGRVDRCRPARSAFASSEHRSRAKPYLVTVRCEVEEVRTWESGRGQTWNPDEHVLASKTLPAITAVTDRERGMPGDLRHESGRTLRHRDSDPRRDTDVAVPRPTRLPLVRGTTDPLRTPLRDRVRRPIVLHRPRSVGARSRLQDRLRDVLRAPPARQQRRRPDRSPRPVPQVVRSGGARRLERHSSTSRSFPLKSPSSPRRCASLTSSKANRSAIRGSSAPSSTRCARSASSSPIRD